MEDVNGTGEYVHIMMSVKKKYTFKILFQFLTTKKKWELILGLVCTSIE